ncbi:hypothetical protein GCM10007989_12030 [Devosia pacifica]|uniref:Cadherin domain-containing protein n=1 Tax=Devosia pacifica TaxID=1335967 RepID=A0A918S0P1_9HYPH|nr:DUF4214 domain-containing protein [Devosia pacifica]GHA18330.1 hypothetical protein GCM10007989_12030 [Devosia pacifica]
MASIQGIYIALFGRPADPTGLAYYNGVTNNGADLSAIGDLSSSAEYQDRFTGMTSEEIVNSIYQSLFERDAEPEGLAFYTALLEESSANINTIAIQILDGAQNEDLATINAKIAAAEIFTANLDLQAEVDAYQGDFAAQVGRDFINEVDADDEGTSDEADAAILRLFPDQGQGPGGGAGGGGGGGAPDSGAGPDTQDPVLTSGTTASIAENSAADTLVYTATATDNRAIDRFEISGTDAADFAIDEDTGAVTINSSPDFETKDSYTFDVTVFDLAGNSDTQEVTISITDVPEPKTMSSASMTPTRRLPTGRRAQPSR